MDLLQELHDFAADGVEVGVDLGEVAGRLVFVEVAVEGDFVAYNADLVVLGVAFAGVIIAIGNVARIGVSGDFISWESNLSFFAVEVAFGLLMLPVVRLVTDKLLLPGQKLTDELVNQENPNIGAAAIEAFSYIAASMLIGWVI